VRRNHVLGARTDEAEEFRRRSHRLPPGTLARIEEYLFRCFETETSPRVSELARVLGLSHRSFIETFHEVLGITPSQYLKLRQLEIARLLLQKTNLSANRVGYVSGFGTRRTFFRSFHSRTGTSPERYRTGTKCP